MGKQHLILLWGLSYLSWLYQQHIARPQNKYSFSNKEEFEKQRTLRGEKLQKIVVLINLQQSKAILFLYQTVTTQKSLKTF